MKVRKKKKNRNLNNNIKHILVVVLLLFSALCTYIGYFEVFVAPKIIDNADNGRKYIRENEILRGNFYDRNGRQLTTMERVDDNTQERTYVDGDLFCHVLGYYNSKYGTEAAENIYNEYLTKGNSSTLKELIKNGFKETPKVGDDVTLTLDYDIQTAAYDAMNGFKGAAVVLDVETGAILAAVSKPTFNANNLEEDWVRLNTDEENNPLYNRAFSGLYPPGSTFKVITALSALENVPGIESKTFKDNGTLTFNKKDSNGNEIEADDYTLSNDYHIAHGTLDLKGAFTVSSNVVFGQVAMEVGSDNLKETAEKFYFNKVLPVQGLYTNKAVSKVPDYTSDGELAQGGIGQAQDLATPLHMAAVAQAIANDGEMMKPHTLSKIEDASGNVVKEEPIESLGQVGELSNIKTLQEYMLNVVEGTKGTGKNAKIPGVKVAGKTGTADHNEKEVDKNGKEVIKLGIAHSWFIGFAPYDKPKYAISVILEEKESKNINAAKVAGDILKVATKK